MIHIAIKLPIPQYNFNNYVYAANRKQMEFGRSHMVAVDRTPMTTPHQHLASSCSTGALSSSQTTDAMLAEQRNWLKRFNRSGGGVGACVTPQTPTAFAPHCTAPVGSSSYAAPIAPIPRAASASTSAQALHGSAISTSNNLTTTTTTTTSANTLSKSNREHIIVEGDGFDKREHKESQAQIFKFDNSKLVSLLSSIQKI